MTGTEIISNVFKECQNAGRPAFVGFMTAGYPTIDEFIPTLLAMQAGGVDLIEVGVPFSDPIAEGIVIQNSSEVAIKNGVDSIDKCLDLVKKAKESGVKVPMLLMGYSNPFCIYGEEKLVTNCKAAGICGFIIVDLPPEESVTFRQLAKREGLSYVPLVTPTTTPQRLSLLIQAADSFIYCISVTGVTGAREQVSSQVPELVRSIKTRTNIPVAVGFGISNNQQFNEVGKHADGVVIGSALIRNLSSTKENRVSHFEEYVKDVCGFNNRSKSEGRTTETHQIIPSEINNLPDTPPQGYFGSFGGRFVPETLTAALDELRQTYEKVKADPTFWEEFRSYYPFMGRPSNLHIAQRLTEHANGARIWLKREDLNHTGAHKINNAIAQALVAKRLGKRRIIAETGAGQHGVATATVCAKLGLELIVYMGEEDCERQALNVFRMKLLGATVVPVTAGSQTLKDAINEAMRDWVTNIHTTHYLVGSAIGPDPFPEMVRDFQSVIGQEIKEQMTKQIGKLPDAVVACVGGGSNAIGTFYPFVEDKQVRLVGAEAAGDGIDSGHHSATLSAGSPGILHGTRTYLLQDERTGQVTPTHSISAGLDYPGVGPEHAWLKDIGRAEYYPVDDKQCLRGFMLLTRLEGIIPALESAHAVYQAVELAKTMKPDQDIVICVSGRGDKDVYTLQAKLPEFGIDPSSYTI